MEWLYMFISLVILPPLYYLEKYLFRHSDDKRGIAIVAIPIVLMAYHFYIFNFDYIPFFGVDIRGNEFIRYFSFIVGYVSCLPYMIASRTYKK